MNVKPYVLYTILVASILVAGGIISSINTSNYSCEINDDGTKITTTISGNYPLNYKYYFVENNNVPDKIYFYYDTTYSKPFGNDESSHRFITDMKEYLSIFDYKNVEIIDAEKLSEILVDSTISSKSIIVFSDIYLPSTVYENFDVIDGVPKYSKNNIYTWLNNNGTILWCDGILGKHISYNNQRIVDYETEMNNYQRSSEEPLSAYYDGENNPLAIPYVYSSYGLQESISNQIIGFKKDGYCSAAITNHFGGSLYIFGGTVSNMTLDVMSHLALYLSAGIDYDTNVIETGKGGGSKCCTFQLESKPGSTLAVTIGDFTLTWGKIHNS